jgi:hypothetical protein
VSIQTWQETHVTSLVDGSAISNSTSQLSLLGVAGAGASASKFSFPPNFLSVGKMLKITAAGRISTVVTTPGTLTLGLLFGAVVIANGGAMALNIVAKTNVPWVLEWNLVCRAIGSSTSANFMHQGVWTSEAVIGSPVPGTGGAGSHMLPNAAPAVGTGFDSTASQVMDIVATWSIANAANSITMHQFRAESLN